MKVAIQDMALPDIGQVVAVDRECYPVSWSAGAYRRELSNPRHARYIVLREQPMGFAPTLPAQPKRGWRDVLGWSRPVDPEEIRTRGRIFGYAGMWLVADEAHITTIAVLPADRGQGYGELLLGSLIDRAMDINIRWVSLEVRASNAIAQRLYRKYGFRDAGRKAQYYSDNNEDALVMTTDDVSLHAYRRQFADLVGKLADRISGSGLVEVSAKVLSFSEVPPQATVTPD